jgi:gluconate kinase
MARQIRIEYDGAAYHVMARGNQGQPIFDDDLDRKMWLETLAEAGEKKIWQIFHYLRPDPFPSFHLDILI